jgi:cytochrome c oxidase assembly factor CtaG
MVQHLLLIMVAAPACLLAHPLPALLWGLPGPLRAAVGRLLRRDAPARRAWRGLTAVPVAWFLHVGVVWLWHLPVAYDAAVGNRILHDLEHLAFFGSAVVFWWPLVNPPPRLRPPAPYGLRIAYLLLAAFQSALLGLLLAMSPWPLYASYTDTPARWGLTPEDDQRLGGLIMWGLGGAVDMLAVLILVQRYLASEDRPAAPARRPRQSDRHEEPVGSDDAR